MIYLFWLYSLLYVSELLSLFDAFTKMNLRYFALIIICFCLVYYFNLYFNNANKLKFFNMPWVLFSILTIPSFLSGMLVAPNNADSMTYHFPRYLHWFENGNLDYFYTSNVRQNISPILPDLLFAEFYSLFSSDRFIFVPIFLSILVSTFYIYKITLLLTNAKNISLLAGAVSLFVPSQLAFMSSSQTDPISTALVTILLYYTILLVKNFVILTK